MNKTRRTALEAIITKLEDLKSEVEELQGEEQEYYDNMPEGLQSDGIRESGACASQFGVGWLLTEDANRILERQNIVR